MDFQPKRTMNWGGHQWFCGIVLVEQDPFHMSVAKLAVHSFPSWLRWVFKQPFLNIASQCYDWYNNVYYLYIVCKNMFLENCEDGWYIYIYIYYVYLYNCIAIAMNELKSPKSPRKLTWQGRSLHAFRRADVDGSWRYERHGKSRCRLVDRNGWWISIIFPFRCEALKWNV